MGRQMRAEEKTIQKMLSYPIKLEHDDGAVLVRAPDFPELTTTGGFGDDRAEALMRAVGALEEAVAARISARQDIPVPSQGETRVLVVVFVVTDSHRCQGHS